MKADKTHLSLHCMPSALPLPTSLRWGTFTSRFFPISKCQVVWCSHNVFFLSRKYATVGGEGRQDTFITPLHAICITSAHKSEVGYLHLTLFPHFQVSGCVVHVDKYTGCVLVDEDLTEPRSQLHNHHPSSVSYSHSLTHTGQYIHTLG